MPSSKWSSSWALACATLAIVPGNVESQSIASELTTIVRGLERDGVRCGVAVRRLSDDAMLYEHRALELFAPASNQKVLTAIHAVRSLGIDYEFSTRFSLVTSGERGTAPLLVVESRGDPTLYRDRAGRGPFDALVAALLREGVTELAGIEYCADGWTGPDRPSDWPRDQLDQDYAAPTGPFVLEEGCLVVEVRPTSPGKLARVSLFPDGLDERELVRGTVKTTRSKAEGRSILVARTPDGVRVAGAIWDGFGPSITRLADPDIERSYRACLEHALRGAGVRVQGASVRATPASTGGESTRVVCDARNPLRVSVSKLLMDSSNFQAEQLLRVVSLESGGEASLAAGVEGLAKRFARVPGGEGLVVRDGSGLSKGNRVTPTLIVTALSRALVDPFGKGLIECFPVAGVSGTIDDRMRSIAGRVRAKTGWIRGVSALSGMVLTASDEVVVFSILMNYDAGRSGLNKHLKAMQDRIVTKLHALTEAVK
ncbi:MAG: D-alanyl-D-alanine carboxypeptidase/D-alanyl-D-alanine-endopeptidase [Planctomycetes bacterium]|nr:D-alanyl-D-alanine carboxypeptidase/D-alanyl-D-alanine-endopeptidase [Planctomycetota bacterium]